MRMLRLRSLVGAVAPSAILAAVATFIVLISAAMTAYPGGTAWDATTHGNDFWLNYLCDLGRRVALDGQPNSTGSVLAQAALLILALGLVLFWWVLPCLFPAHRRLGRAVRALGSTALVGTLAVALLPSDRFAALHPASLVLAGVPSLVAAFLAVAGLAREERAPKLGAVVGAAALLVSGVDFALYIGAIGGGGSAPMAEAVLERVSLILVLAWMCTVAWRVKGLGLARTDGARGCVAIVAAASMALQGCSLVGLGIGSATKTYEEVAGRRLASPDALPTGSQVEVTASTGGDPEEIDGTIREVRPSEIVVGIERARDLGMASYDTRTIPVDRVLRLRRRDGTYWAEGLTVGIIVDTLLAAAVLAWAHSGWSPGGGGGYY